MDKLGSDLVNLHSMQADQSYGTSVHLRTRKPKGEAQRGRC